MIDKESPSFVSANEYEQTAASAMDIIPASAVTGAVSDLISEYGRQQREAIGAQRVGDPERHSSTSTASEIAERRKIEFGYLLSVVGAVAMTMLGIVLLPALASRGSVGLTSSVWFWFGSWAALTGLCSMAVILKLNSQAREHTPEGLALAKEYNDHDIRLRIADAEVRRYDAGTTMLTAQAERTRIENEQLRLRVADRAKLTPQSAHNALVDYVEPQDSQLAEAEQFRHKLLSYLLSEAANVGDSGQLRGPVPWAARGSFTKPEADRAKRFFQSAEGYAGFWIVKYDNDLRAWRLNTARIQDGSALLAALSGVKMSK